MTSREKEDLALYQLKDITQVWFTQWKDTLPIESGLLVWEKFKGSSLKELLSL